jgi:hypothetical protein
VVNLGRHFEHRLLKRKLWGQRHMDGHAVSSSTELNSILNILLNFCHTAHSIIGYLEIVHLLQKQFSIYEVALTKQQWSTPVYTCRN